MLRSSSLMPPMSRHHHHHHHPEQRMQPPTCTAIRIRSVKDAHIMFHAVMTGILPMVSRRLDTEERRAVRAGNVYVWEERGRHSEATGLGIERWTDGIRWSASRVRDEFLLYHERDSGVEMDFPDMDPYGHADGSPSSHSADIRTSNRLVKQTYSVFVDTNQGRRKWHLTAYFIPATVGQLHTVDDIPQLANLRPPAGMYTSAKVGKGRAPADSSSDIHGTSVSGMSSQPYPTYAPFPSAPGPPHPPGLHMMPPPGGPSSPHSPHGHRAPAWPAHGAPPPSPLSPIRDGHGAGNSGRMLPGLPPPPALGLAPAPPVHSPYSPRHPLDNEALRSLNRAI